LHWLSVSFGCAPAPLLEEVEAIVTEEQTQPAEQLKLGKVRAHQPDAI